MTSEPEKIDPQGIALLAGLGDLRKGLTGAYAQVVCQSELRKHVLAYLEDNLKSRQQLWIGVGIS